MPTMTTPFDDKISAWVARHAARPFPCGHARTVENTSWRPAQNTARCRPCGVAYVAGWRKADRPRHVASVRRRNYKQRTAVTGWTPEMVEAARIAQGGLCAICERHETEFSKGLNADHDHARPASISPRALLCAPCNRMLGLAQDNPQRLLRAAEYVANYRRA